MSFGATSWKRTRILLIEDDPGDQEITRRAFRGDQVSVDLRVVSDGKEAMDFLFQRGAYGAPGSAPRPDLILLDLNLPDIGGMQVLQAAKADWELRSTPVVVLTTSARERDVEESYQLGCNSYVIKPLDAHRFVAVLREVYGYWFGPVTLPSR